MTNRWIFALCTLVALIGSQCSKDNTDDGGKPQIEPKITLNSPQSITMASTANSSTISFSSNVAWTAKVVSVGTEPSTWCTLSPAKGDAGTGSIQVSVSGTASIYDNLVAQVVIEAGTATKTIDVSRKKKDALILDKNLFSIAPAGETISVTLKSNINYEIVIPSTVESWVSQVGSKALVEETLQFKISPYASGLEPRTATITIRDKASTLSDEITITQAPQHVIVPIEYMQLRRTGMNNVTITMPDDNTYQLVTTGGDPYLFTEPLTKALAPDSVILTFEYKTATALSGLQIFFAPISEARSLKLPQDLPATNTWSKFSIKLKTQLTSYDWGKVGDYLRLDIGDDNGRTFHIRNIYFRGMNDAEKEEQRKEEEEAEKAANLENNLKNYLAHKYSAEVTSVEATASKITIKGTYSGTGSYALAEIPVYQDIVTLTKFDNTTALSDNNFTVTLNRTIARDGYSYDRILSRWAIIKTGTTSDELMSHARYADVIPASQSLAAVKPATKKGLGGYFLCEYESDLDDLGITSVTVNVPLTSYMRTTGGNTYSHTYMGKTYYFEKSQIDALDNTLKSCLRRNIVVAAIILIQKKAECADQTIGGLLQHPNYTANGIYTMPNMTNAASVNCYAAGLDFLAERYCKAGSPNGRIHHWIMHNEVDAGSDWTNMGSPAITTYTDTYIKSMRMCYNIARGYDPNTEVFASFTHSWTGLSGNYPVKSMLQLLLDYSNSEGDFQWALACHPYPQDLTNPRTWKDGLATFSMNSPLVTFKNLEVLNKWILQSSHLYKGTKRSLWLSENGTNSPSYSTSDLNLQAAGFAYAWKKIKALDGIDGIQWHNWMDNPVEYGLRIGLRMYPANNREKKTVWYAYQAAGTANEDSIFEPYLSIIGIPDWDILHTISD